MGHLGFIRTGRAAETTALLRHGFGLALLWHVRTDRQRPQNFVPTPDARRFFLCACPGLWRRHSRRRGANGGAVVRKTSRFVHVLPVGVVAQLVERLVRNEKVAGSIPVGSTTGKQALGGAVSNVP